MATELGEVRRRITSGTADHYIQAGGCAVYVCWAVRVISYRSDKRINGGCAAIPATETDDRAQPLLPPTEAGWCILTASISGWSMVVLRRIIAGRLERTRDSIEAGSRDALLSLHLSGMTMDMLRAGLVTMLGMIIFSPLVRAIVAIWGSESAPSRAVVVVIAAIVAGGALWKVFHSIRRVVWLFLGGLLASTILLVMA